MCVMCKLHRTMSGGRGGDELARGADVSSGGGIVQKRKKRGPSHNNGLIQIINGGKRSFESGWGPIVQLPDEPLSSLPCK